MSPDELPVNAPSGLRMIPPARLVEKTPVSFSISSRPSRRAHLPLSFMILSSSKPTKQRSLFMTMVGKEPWGFQRRIRP